MWTGPVGCGGADSYNKLDSETDWLTTLLPMLSVRWLANRLGLTTDKGPIQISKV